MNDGQNEGPDCGKARKYVDECIDGQMSGGTDE